MTPTAEQPRPKWTILIVAFFFGMIGCSHNPSGSKSKATESKPETMAEWVAKRNAEKKPCSEKGWFGAGGNGYESWQVGCLNGITVFADTTAETQKWEAEISAHKFALARALVSRCLTAKEFAEATDYGYQLYIEPMEPFREDDLRARFNAALQTQQIIRTNCPSKEPK